MSAIYQLGQNGIVIRLLDGAIIPNDPHNTDYAAYLAWVAAGNTASPAPALTLAQAQAAQISTVTAACAAAIVAGFASSALGAEHSYPSQMTDQQNLSASVLASLLPNLPTGWTTPFWCADTNGNWSYASHTAAQIQQAGQDGKAAIVAAIQKKEGLVAQINAAATVTAVQAINWN